MDAKGTNFCSFSVGLEPATLAYEAAAQFIPPPRCYLIDSVNCPPSYSYTSKSQSLYGGELGIFLCPVKRVGEGGWGDP